MVLHNPMSMVQTWRGPDIAMQMVEGLNYAFIRGISHRDMKLSNVLISSHGVAQLVDFGLAAATGKSAKGVEEHPNPRAIDYAGLERVTGVRKDDKRSDIYFLGCMYYNLKKLLTSLGHQTLWAPIQVIEFSGGRIHYFPHNKSL